MSSVQKTPFSRTLNRFAQSKALDEIQKRGQGLPGHVAAVSGSIVTINFDVEGVTLPQVTMPMFGPEYIRYPIQVGDAGTAIAVSVSLGKVSGLGTGTADTSFQGNLSTLLWMPVANKNFSAQNPNVVTIYGPSGVTLQTQDGATYVTIFENQITLSCGGHSLIVGPNGVIIDGITFGTHVHTLTQPGTGEGGPPLAGS